MNLLSIVIGIIIASSVLIGGSIYYKDIVDTYAPTNATSSAEFDKFNETYDKMAELSGSFENHTIGFTTKSLIDPSKYSDALMAFIDVGGVILQIPNIMIDTVNNAFSFIPVIPDWFRYMTYTIISIVIVFVVASVVLKRDTL